MKQGGCWNNSHISLSAEAALRAMYSSDEASRRVKEALRERERDQELEGKEPPRHGATTNV